VASISKIPISDQRRPRKGKLTLKKDYLEGKGVSYKISIKLICKMMTSLSREALEAARRKADYERRHAAGARPAFRRVNDLTAVHSL
jgi:hypothetical protein